MTILPAAADPARRVGLPALFAGFLVVSLFGFGGPIVWARRFLVERYRWLGDREFADLLGLCQFLPGPNVVALTVVFGPNSAALRALSRRLPALS